MSEALTDRDPARRLGKSEMRHREEEEEEEGEGETLGRSLEPRRGRKMYVRTLGSWSRHRVYAVVPDRVAPKSQAVNSRHTANYRVVDKERRAAPGHTGWEETICHCTCRA